MKSRSTAHAAERKETVAADFAVGNTDELQQPALRLLQQAGEARAMLPTLATAGDLREVVQYLRKKPQGVSVTEAAEDVKKRLFEPLKVSAYEYWGVVERQHGRLRLSAEGWQLARSLEPEAEAHRALLRRTDAYHAALEWIARQDDDLITFPMLAEFWRGAWPELTGGVTEGNAVCFFHLCQAAGLGVTTIGKRGQPARLRVDREELARYFEGAPSTEASGSRTAVAARRIADRAETALRVFVSAGEGDELCRQVRATLELAGHECRVVARRTARPALISEETARAMRECGAAVVIATSDDCREGEAARTAPDTELLIHLSTASVLYEGRVILLRERSLNLPAELGSLPHLPFERDGLTWNIGLGLLEYARDFQRRVAP